MVTIGSLWIPILVSAIIVWFASFLVWVVLPHHKSEYKGLPDEDATVKSLGDIPPGLYNLPHLKWKKSKSRKSSGRTLGPGTPYLKVFQIVGTVAWLAHGWGVITDGIGS